MATHHLRGGLFALLACSAFLSLGFAFDGDTDSKEPEPPPPPANTPLAVILMRAGLDAEALCAAGITSESIGSLVGSIDAQVDASPDALPTLDATFAQARVTRYRLRRLVRSGQGSSEDVTALSQAQHDFEAARSARESFFDVLRQTLIAGVAQDTAQTLQRIVDNRTWKLPTQYGVLDRGEGQWVELRDALAVKRISENYDEDFPADVQSYLASIDALPAIAAAKVRLDTHLADVQTAWNAAVSD